MYICIGHMFVALHFIDFGVKRNPDYYGLKASLPFVVLCWFAKPLNTPILKTTALYGVTWKEWLKMWPD